MRRALPWALVAVAVLLLLAPIDPALVERWYSGRLYLRLQPGVTAVSNRVSRRQALLQVGKRRWLRLV